ncbi:vacuolar sorting protein VPS1 [Xylaria cf. heliscus]|nr:vacuolar sorting protein VPS1 [Xylaria cf. heliscus]
MASTPEDNSPSTTPPSSVSDTENIPKTEGDDDAISENPFDSESSRILFDAVDQLQHCGANRHVDIPQLVIVGGQSTGKSSLLQSLTDIPFPVGTGCCTRFATRIVSKRTAPGTANRFKITIVDPEVNIEGFEYPMSNSYREYVHMGETLGAEEFKTIMDEVSNDYMGIRSGKGPGRKNFATQVLRVELSGPGRSFFSIVDIPGLFVNPDTVNEGEMHGIKSMIIEYMKKPENFVICVADAVTDLANQGIVHLATLHVSKERCVGVLTKCDMLRDDEETSSKIVGIATGQQDHTTKPICDTWFVVRNRSSREDKSFDLAEAERQLFERSPWNEINFDRRGTRMLRMHLSSLLSRRIRGNFPSIRARILELLGEAQKSRAVLGNSRRTHSDRLQYLRDVVERYAALATNALEKPGLLPEELRARNKVKAANDEFTRLMHISGHKHQFEDPDMDPLEEVRRMMAEKNESSKDEQDDQAPNPQVPFQFNTESKQSASGPSAFQFSPPKKPRSYPPYQTNTENKPSTPPGPSSSHVTPKKSNSTPSSQSVFANNVGKPLRSDIREELRAFEGTQLPGLINPEVMPVLFQKQTEKWHEHASKHVDTIANHLGVVARGILDLVCPPNSISGNTQLYDGLFKILEGFWEKSRAVALAEVETMCIRERTHMLQTTDSRFYQRLKAWQTIRLLRSLDSVHPGLDATAIHDRVHFSMEDNMVNAVHDILKVYYQISMESFIRNITHNVVENFVSGCRDEAKGPLKGLSKDWVYSLTTEEVEQLAREDDQTISKRAMLDEQIRGLQAADEIAQRATDATSNLGYM